MRRGRGRRRRRGGREGGREGEGEGEGVGEGVGGGRTVPEKEKRMDCWFSMETCRHEAEGYVTEKGYGNITSTVRDQS